MFGKRRQIFSCKSKKSRFHKLEKLSKFIYDTYAYDIRLSMCQLFQAVGLNGLEKRVCGLLAEALSRREPMER